MTIKDTTHPAWVGHSLLDGTDPNVGQVHGFRRAQVDMNDNYRMAASTSGVVKESRSIRGEARVTFVVRLAEFEA